eukprot:Nitzschia sp. Nitz4//scaffold29_size155292//106718//109484//NITZ4_002675-RA/size155292-augustus-gene-0.211-mRNA-1//1//CDS//3329546499//8786//frame0
MSHSPPPPPPPQRISSRIQSMDNFVLEPRPSETATRRQTYQRKTFSRSSSDGGADLGNRSQRSNDDDLDCVMRRGVSKASSLHSSPATGPRAFEEDEVPDLDSLLAAGSQSPGMSVRVASATRIPSYVGLAGFRQHSVTDTPESLAQHQFFLPKGDSQASLNMHHPGLSIDDDSPSSSSSPAFHLGPRAPEPPMVMANSTGYTTAGWNASTQQHSLGQQMERTALHGTPYSQSPQSPSHVPQLPALIPPKVSGRSASLGYMDNALASFAVGTPPSSIPESLPYNETVDADMKRAFTNFHNQARFARDSTSPFLGGSGEFRHTPPSETYLRNTVMGGGGTSMPTQALSERDLVAYGRRMGASSPVLETVDENTIEIKKSLRLLKPIQGTEVWESGRRYLITPSVMAACQLSVFNSRQYSGDILTVEQAVGSLGYAAANLVDLGECLATYIGSQQHLSSGKWSSCRMVLRQNYLLEYEAETPLTSMPRGYVHLQYARAVPHAVFQDALEVDFFASPCARADRRQILISVKNKAERDHWITCLNAAADLNIEDLWDIEGETELGVGRYSTVFPARRKYGNSSLAGDNNMLFAGENAESGETFNCALKIVDKNQFWKRVVKGRERPDTLVREASVQATLTTRFAKCQSFLRLRGVFETVDNYVMELELLEGKDLFQHLSEIGNLKEDEAAFIFRDIVNCLEAMDRAGVAHRDIKPANILVCQKEEERVHVKVCDYGMATFVGVDSMLRGRCGTPGYVAPEVLNAGAGAGYGNKVDLFSAGVTLYVLLCGYEPFYGENELELIEANKKSVLEFPDREWKSISSDAKDLILRLTTADPNDRISAKEALQHPWIVNYCKVEANTGTTEWKVPDDMPGRS